MAAKRDLTDFEKLAVERLAEQLYFRRFPNPKLDVQGERQHWETLAEGVDKETFREAARTDLGLDS